MFCPWKLFLLSLCWNSGTVYAGTVVFYGDSITYAEEGAANQYVGLISRKFPDHQMVNAGRKGRKSSDIYNLHLAMAAEKPVDVVVLFLGTYDFASPNPDRGKIILSNIKLLVQEASINARDCRIVLVTPPDIILERLPEYWKVKRKLGAHTPKELDSYRKLLKEYAAAEKFPLVELAGKIDPEHMPDGIHPDAKGHEILSKAIGSAVWKALQ